MGNFRLTEKGLARFVSAVQHGFLPDVRRRVYTTIVDPVKRRVALRLKAKYPKATRDALASKLKTQAESEARKLTADFIRALWPTFGRTTNQVNVALALSTTK